MKQERRWAAHEHFVTAEEWQWQAISIRPRQVRGDFVYAVTTTGVFCSPGCSSRLPLRRNIRCFPTAGDAESAGFRACKRCGGGLRPPASSSAGTSPKSPARPVR
ncbi:MAG: Ada metal-binding domain-containing protein [Rhabdaerophilum sp.]